MKELPIEEKAKRFDEVIEKFDVILNLNTVKESGTIFAEDVRKIFPELKASDDERIIKGIIKETKGSDVRLFETLTNDEFIAWLEKQGEQKPAKAKAEHLIPQKGAYYTCIKDYYSSDNAHLCVKGNIYKSPFNGYIDDESHLGLSWTNSCAEKYFEPTKDDDWIVCEYDNVVGKPMQYKEFKKKIAQKFVENLKAKGVTPNLRLWTIQDAKDGDVLVSQSQCDLGTWYGIFKSLDDNESMTVHCYLARDGKFETRKELCFDKDVSGVKPATKEQRDTLEKAMADDGYTFDFEKKELKMIENEIEIPFGAKDSELQEVTYYIPTGFHAEIDDNKVVIKKGEKPAAWSEEDKNFMYDTLSNLTELKDRYGEGYGNAGKCIDWLKSIKDRVRPQNLTVTDEELAQAKKNAYNDALDKIEYNSGEPSFDDGWSAAIWYLKKRNIQSQPKNEWSEEDKKSREKQKINAANEYVKERGYNTGQLDVAYIEGIEWADEHPKWKPSEEQIKAVDIAIRCGIQLGTWEEKALKTLNEQLKKLKG